MDFARDGSRPDFDDFPSLALAMIRFLILFLSAVGLAFSQSVVKSSASASSPSSSAVYYQYVFQPLAFTLTNPGASTVYFDFSAPGISMIRKTIPAGQTVVVNFNHVSLNTLQNYFYPLSAAVSWSGLTNLNTSVTGSYPASSYVLSYTWRNSTYVASGSGSIPVSGAAGSSSVSYLGGNQSVTVFLLSPLPISAAFGATDLTAGTPNVPKVFGSGVLFIDNLTGIDQKSAFGAEEVNLKPGYNSIPFTGELDANGFPKAMPSNWALSKSVGPDGQVVWSGRIASGIEGGPPVWTEIRGAEVLAGTSGSGPTVKVPNGRNPALNDYVTLPAGMSKGSYNTLPGGMTAGSPGLPPGMTGGSSGALPSGVLSGGGSYLPSGVSPGTTASTGGVSSGPIAGTGSTGTTSGPSTQGEAGGYIPGASMGGMEEAGIAKGRASADKLKADGKAALDGFGGKVDSVLGSGANGLASTFWTTGGDGAVSGQDPSWLSVSIPIAQWNVPLTIPPHWVSLIRSILLWGVKIWFVTAVLKLLMR